VEAPPRPYRTLPSGGWVDLGGSKFDVFTGSTQAMALDATALSEVRANVLRGMLLFSFL
jgi:hypothetical protein